jgi:uncharacterized protein
MTSTRGIVRRSRFCWLILSLTLALPSFASAAAPEAEIARTTRLANEGDAAAQVALGILHETGDGLPQNPTEASKWYRRAAEQNDPEGAFRLGWLYARGEGLPQNLEQAVHWYEIAANHGHPTAQLSLGWIYFNGDGVPRNVETAARWFKLAAARGEAAAQYTLGTIYSGAYDDVPQNLDEAAKWFLLAAEQGEPGAQFRLGEMYGRGEGVSVDAAEAYFWLSLAASRLADGGFKQDAVTARTAVAGKLSAAERQTVDQRTAAWRPRKE